MSKKKKGLIDPSGQIRTCNHSPHVVGHIFQKPLISDTAYWNMFAKSDYKPEACGKCRMVELCDCGCREVAQILHGNIKEIEEDYNMWFADHLNESGGYEYVTEEEYKGE